MEENGKLEEKRKEIPKERKRAGAKKTKKRTFKEGVVEVKKEKKEKIETEKAKKKKGRIKIKVSESSTVLTQEMMIIREGPEYYGITLDYVDEIKKDISLIEAPHLPEYVSGVTEIREVMVPVVDFSNLMGLSERKKRRTQAIVLKISGQIIGFQVDEVVEIVKISKEEILPLPEIFPSILLSGAYDYNSKIVGILRLEGLLKGKHLQPLKDLE